MISLFIFLAPFPLWTNAEGVVWLPEHSHVHAEADAFVREILVEPGQYVEAGTPLIRTEASLLKTLVRLHYAEVAELEARLAALRFSDRARADATRKELATAVATRDDAVARLADRLTDRHGVESKPGAALDRVPKHALQKVGLFRPSARKDLGRGALWLKLVLAVKRSGRRQAAVELEIGQQRFDYQRPYIESV